MSLINTINSITAVDLDNFAPQPTVDAKGTHGGYCGPAVKPIAMNMVAEIARDAETRGMPISGIGGIETWRDAAEFMALGAGNVQVCTAAMVYGFKIVREMIDGLSDWMDQKGHRTLDDIVARAVPNITDWQYLNLNYIAKARIDQELCIKCGRCHIACEDTSHSGDHQHGRRGAPFRGHRRRMCGLVICASPNVCPVGELHHALSHWQRERSTSAPASRYPATMPTGPRIPTTPPRASRPNKAGSPPARAGWLIFVSGSTALG